VLRASIPSRSLPRTSPAAPCAMPPAAPPLPWQTRSLTPAACWRCPCSPGRA